MPVDETLLETKKNLLTDKIKLLYQEIEQLTVIHSNIVSIEMIQDSKFPKDRTKKVLPNDSTVGGKVSTGRRQQVYDKIFTDLTGLGL